MLPHGCILLFCLFFTSLSSFNGDTASSLNLTLSLRHQKPNPEFVVHEVKRRVNESISRRRRISSTSSSSSNTQPQCLTGNPIDDCWRCDPKWAANRYRLAECAVGFGKSAGGGKDGRIYVVTDSSDRDVVNPMPGTLRHAVIQDEHLWIVFKSSMAIKLKHELIVNSHKTIDGRGAYVRITGNGCITLQYISNVIIHNVHVYDCRPSGNTNIRSSPTHFGYRGKSDGDGISIFGSRNIWIDHCTLSHCTDGLVDVIMGSTGITISNNYFSHHNEVMLLGHDDNYSPDSEMQVTIAFNRFGEGLVQRMPRCRLGYVHVVNNDYIEWKLYAIGGSANPTINSEGNRYTASTDPSVKEVTRREDTKAGEWSDWNWRTNGDIMLNGAFFVPSGEGASLQASSVEPKSANYIDQLTMNAGVIGGPRDNSGGSSSDGVGTIIGTGSDSGGGGGGGGGGSSSSGVDDFGMIFASEAAQAHSLLPPNIIILSFLTTTCIILYITANRGGLQ